MGSKGKFEMMKFCGDNMCLQVLTVDKVKEMGKIETLQTIKSQTRFFMM